MSSTINSNYTARAYGSFSKHSEKKSEKSTEKSFVDSVEEKSAKKTEQTTEASGTKAVSTSDMTMAEYKQYIYNKLSAIPLHPSRMLDNISIHISEKGFEAMKNDPEYEAWVLDHMAKDFAVNDPWSAICGGSYSVHYIGASKEEYHGIGWYEGYQGGKGASLYKEKSQGCFWERKAQRGRRMEAQYEDWLEKRALTRKWQQEQLNAELLDRKAENDRLLKTWNSRRQMSHASAAYEANVVVEHTGGGEFGNAMAGAAL